MEINKKINYIFLNSLDIDFSDARDKSKVHFNWLYKWLRSIATWMDEKSHESRSILSLNIEMKQLYYHLSKSRTIKILREGSASISYQSITSLQLGSFRMIPRWQNWRMFFLEKSECQPQGGSILIALFGILATWGLTERFVPTEVFSK